MWEQAVPVVPVVQAARAGAVRAVLVTTSMWQRGGYNNVAVTSTWLGAAPGAGPPGLVRPAGPDEALSAGACGARSVQPTGFSLPKSRAHATSCRCFMGKWPADYYVG